MALPRGHPYHDLPVLAFAQGLVTVRQPTLGDGSAGPPAIAGEGAWIVVEPAVCFSIRRPALKGLAYLGGELWAEWEWIDSFHIEDLLLHTRFRFGAENRAEALRDVELQALDPAQAADVAAVCQPFLRFT